MCIHSTCTSVVKEQVYMASSSGSPCAACKFLRRKCTAECVFAPYFPPDQPLKFANVHKIFGASNISKLLNELPPHQREDAVNSLAYEADARVKDPVYGCVGAISLLQRQVAQLQQELGIAQSDLARAASGAILAQQHHHQHHHGLDLNTSMGMLGMGMHQQQQQLRANREAHLAELQQQQQQIMTREQWLEIARTGGASASNNYDMFLEGGGSGYNCASSPTSRPTSEANCERISKNSNSSES